MEMETYHLVEGLDTAGEYVCLLLTFCKFSSATTDILSRIFVTCG